MPLRALFKSFSVVFILVTCWQHSAFLPMALASQNSFASTGSGSQETAQAQTVQNQPVQEEPKPQIFRYTGPKAKPGENYGLTVLQREPAFQEAELLRFCDDVYPAVGSPPAMLAYMQHKKGWEPDRVFYLMSRLTVGCAFLKMRTQNPAAEPQQPPLAPAAEELALIQMHTDRIPDFFGGSRVTGNPQDPAFVPNALAEFINPFESESAVSTVLAANPEFSEEELQRALRDMQGSTKWLADKVVDVLMEKGWPRNRAFYMVMRIRMGLNAIANDKSRAAFAKEMPHALPTAQEELLIKKYKKDIKALQFREGK